MDRPKETYSDKDQGAMDAQNELDNRSPEDCLEWSDEDWKNEHSKLENLPFLTADRKLYSKIIEPFDEVSRVRALPDVSAWDPNALCEMVDPRLIVRAPAFDNWSTHYHPCHTEDSKEKNESSVVEIARKIVRNVTPLTGDDINDEKILESLDDVFEKRGVKLKKIHGPRGPIYLVVDGSHRTASAKLVGLKKIWASVGECEPEKGIDLWFEACRDMPEEAIRELMRIYDLIYPPTKEGLENEKKLFREAQDKSGEYLEMKKQYYIERKRTAIAESLRYPGEEEILEGSYAIYEKLRYDEVFKQIQKEEALEHIRRYMQEYEDEADEFYEEYRCEMTSFGCLLNRDGSESSTHVLSYDVGYNSHLLVISRAVKEYERRYPDEIAK